MEQKTVLTIVVLALLAVALQIAVWVFRPREEPRAFVGPPRSDYSLTNFTIDALDDEGKLSFRVIGPRLTHKGEDGSVYVDTPDYLMLDNSGNTWTGKSDAAWVNKYGTIMRLDGFVFIDTATTEKVQPADIVTS